MRRTASCLQTTPFFFSPPSSGEWRSSPRDWGWTRGPLHLQRRPLCARVARPWCLYPRAPRGRAVGADAVRRSAARHGPRGPRRVARLPAGLIAGGVLFFGASFQQIGIVTTTAGKAGFITGPLRRARPAGGVALGPAGRWSSWAGAVLSVAGLFLLSVTDTFTMERGDLLVLIGAFFWAAHVQVVGWLSPRTDPFRLSCVQFAVCSLAVRVRRRADGACRAVAGIRPALLAHPVRRGHVRRHRLHAAGRGAAARARRPRRHPPQPGDGVRGPRAAAWSWARASARAARSAAPSCSPA